MGAPAVQGWDQQIAQKLGIKATPAVIRFLHLWSQAEGGSATNNPFNTTQPGFGSTGNYNSVGVKNYATPEQGIDATVHTLQNGRYGNIIDAMKRGASPIEMAQALAASPWGTGALVLKMLGQNTPVTAPQNSTGLPDVNPKQAPLPGLPNVGTAPTLQSMFNASGPSASTVSLLQKLGGIAGKAAQAGQAPIALPSALGNQPLVGYGGLPGPSTPGQVAPAPLPTDGQPPEAQDLSKWVKVSGNANRQGHPIQAATLNFVDQVAQVWGKPLTIGTGTNHNQYVVGTHRESDHWTGYGADIPATGATLTRMGQSALIAAGADPNWARKQTGGVYNINGKQILFNTHVGGNHFNHLHVGIRTR